MDKELQVFKKGKGTFELKSVSSISGRHLLVELSEDDHVFQIYDALWAIEDKNRGVSTNMLVVDEIRDNGSLVVSRSNKEFLHTMREFNVGENFTLIATFREK
jgi:hypothetical protein